MEMILTANSISDTTIVSMMTENNLSAWEHLYDKYAPMMYGAIFQITGDAAMAEEIFKKCFLELKENDDLLKVKTALCPFLLRHAHSATLNYLKNCGLASVVTGQASFNDDPLIQLLSSENVTINESKSNFTQKKARKKLREEFNILRNQRKQKVIY
jgi:DNA-directed RNA polymerase specialized sigma24 family protein